MQILHDKEQDEELNKRIPILINHFANMISG
jgi:hypothetical protein